MNSSESSFRIQNDSNEWSLSDYKRRVSSTATVEASYASSVSAISHWSDPSVSNIIEYRRSFPLCTSIDSSLGATKSKFSMNLGLAAGGQMYGARDLRLLIVSLISSTERRKYTVA